MTTEPDTTKPTLNFGSKPLTQPPAPPRPWLDWIGPLVVCLALLLMAALRGWQATEPFQMAVRWLSIAIIVAAAWVCPPRMALTACLLALVAWSAIEIQTAQRAPWWPGHLVRLLVAMGLVLWLIRVHDQLTTARRLARIDSLTKLPNRQALIESLEAEIGRSRRFGRPFSVAVLDCDGFKQINDQKGHLAGDEVLRRIGETLREQSRPFDCAGRWGGDEFLLVLSEMDRDDAELAAERLRAALRHHVERDHPTVTISLGVVTVVSAHQVQWQDCVRLADEAMYAAKRTGRDQTRFSIVGANWTSES